MVWLFLYVMNSIFIHIFSNYIAGFVRSFQTSVSQVSCTGIVSGRLKERGQDLSFYSLA